MGRARRTAGTAILPVIHRVARWVAGRGPAAAEHPGQRRLDVRRQIRLSPARRRRARRCGLLRGRGRPGRCDLPSRCGRPGRCGSPSGCDGLGGGAVRGARRPRGVRAVGWLRDRTDEPGRPRCARRGRLAVLAGPRLHARGALITDSTSHAGGRAATVGPGSAVAADDLAQGLGEMGRAAGGTPVERRAPVGPRLAVRADEDLFAADDRPAPGARPAGRIGLTGVAAITRHDGPPRSRHSHRPSASLRRPGASCQTSGPRNGAGGGPDV